MELRTTLFYGTYFSVEFHNHVYFNQSKFEVGKQMMKHCYQQFESENSQCSSSFSLVKSMITSRIIFALIISLFNEVFTLGEDELLESKVRCLDKSFRYRKRPESRMEIRTELAIMSIDSISSAKMELSADVYLIHEWIDRRCSWSAIPGT